MKGIEFNFPRKLVLGPGSLNRALEDISALGFRRIFILADPALIEKIRAPFSKLENKAIDVTTYSAQKGEPRFADYETIAAVVKSFNADCIIGVGGGSVLDLAKLTARLIHEKKNISEFVGSGLIPQGGVYLICMPTTSGAGSEASPNAILIDHAGDKMGIISPYLVPDAVYADPELTSGMPPSVTAYTGLDALTHCIEAYTNRFAHPMADTLALEGIRLISGALKGAFDNGADLESRSDMALGSLYGGMVLGPVNTAAVHALAYPLGTKFKIPHGLSNALLLPYVMEYNLEAAPERYAAVARALGAPMTESAYETGSEGIEIIKRLISGCKVPSRLSQVDIPENAIEDLAASAMQVQRLLKNNIREIRLEDAMAIYKKAY